MAAVKFHSWGMKIHGCPLGSCISIFGCPAIVLVVLAARTTKILSAALHHLPLHLYQIVYTTK